MKRYVLAAAAAALLLVVPQFTNSAEAKPFPIYDYLQKIENTDWIVAETLRWTPESGANLKGYYVFRDEDIRIVTVGGHRIIQLPVHILRGKNLKHFSRFLFSVDPANQLWGTDNPIKWEEIDDFAPQHKPFDPVQQKWAVNFSGMAQMVMQYVKFERPDLYKQLAVTW